MLGREHQARHLDRLAAGVAQRELRLGVRPEPRLRAALAHLGQPAQHRVGIVDRRRHQLGRLVDRVAEHDALVARALLLALGGVDALGDVLGLAVDVVVDAQGRPVEALLLVADVAHAVAHDLLDPRRARRPGPRTSPPTTTRSVVAKVSQATRASGSLGQEGVEHRVGDPVADLVGMPLGHRFGREEILAPHAHSAKPLTEGTPASLCSAAARGQRRCARPGRTAGRRPLDGSARPACPERGPRLVTPKACPRPGPPAAPSHPPGRALPLVLVWRASGTGAVTSPAHASTRGRVQLRAADEFIDKAGSN